MGSEGPMLGGSLEVPSVQELAKQPLIRVPTRYVRTDLDGHPAFTALAEGGEPSSRLPIIDMARLASDPMDSEELDKLHRACKEWGFFHLINHGISSAMVEKVKREVEGFFKLPIEEKNKYKQLAGELEGYGQMFVRSEEQKLDWADRFHIVILPTYLRKQDFFPELLIYFRETFESYSVELRNLSLKLLECMTKALKMDEKHMRALFEEGKQSTRMNYYPPCPQPDVAIGLTPHSDPMGLTILLQVNEMEGLQIKKDGKWILVKPLSDALVVNIGDVLEIVTNGIYKSIEHRAVVNSVKERISIATFYSIKHDGEIGPAPSLITPQTLALFKRIAAVDFYIGFFSRELRGKLYIDELRTQREEALID
ncbi:hypothetical protein Nepgr_032082 [Nepenthes gracilis]|uniref:Fe2OG dioxygenase domain-containing protein n=1 Tax=Nepenthes gracilis TaxID=150966 RepID=A0AAD3Y7L5_NEPGR|nr:hypothetical protein Nepgr_032082 [Nepenthes gracilis]